MTDTTSGLSADRPTLRPYVRFLLRRGERRGRLLAALIPSLFYASVPVVFLVDLLIRSAAEGIPMSRPQAVGIVAFVAVGMAGATVNALVLWRKSHADEQGGTAWILGLSAPLTVALWIGAVVFNDLSVGGGREWVRLTVSLAILATGYVALNPLSALWPTFRQYAPRFAREL